MLHLKNSPQTSYSQVWRVSGHEPVGALQVLVRDVVAAEVRSHRATIFIAGLLSGRVAHTLASPTFGRWLVPPRRHLGSSAACLGAGTPFCPLPPLAIHRAAVCIARLLSVRIACAIATSTNCLLLNHPSGGQSSSTTGYRTTSPCRPWPPLAVHRAAIFITGLACLCAARAAPSSILCLLLDASGLLLGSPTACLGAGAPLCPLRPFAVHLWLWSWGPWVTCKCCLQRVS